MLSIVHDRKSAERTFYCIRCYKPHQGGKCSKTVEVLFLSWQKVVFCGKGDANGDYQD